MEIIPAILSNNLKDFKRKLHATQCFAKRVHIDFADGKFVSSQTLGPEDLRFVSTVIPWSFHLMVAEPERNLEKYWALKPETMYFHAEIDNLAKNIDRLLDYGGVKIGVALNPETSVDAIAPFIEKIAAVLVMTVEPGSYGAKFLPGQLHKVGELRKMKDDLEIGVDGGVSLSTIEEIKENNPDFVIAGSFIFAKNKLPENQYRLLESALRKR